MNCFECHKTLELFDKQHFNELFERVSTGRLMLAKTLFSRRLDVDVLPFHCLKHWLNAENDDAILKESNGPG